MNERIKELRKALELSGEKFGARLGIGKTAISKIERGENNVTEQMFKSICREFNVNEEWLRSGEGEMFDLPEDETAAIVAELLEESNPFYEHILRIVKTYQNLDEKSQAVLDNFMLQLFENESNDKD